VQPQQAAAPLAGFHHDRWGMEDGLPENRITGIAQSADGYLWLGTSEGLVRFDGVRFTLRNRGDSIATPLLHPLFADHEGRLWVTTADGGLALYQDGHFRPAGPATAAIAGGIHQLSEADSGGLWLISGRGSAWSWRDGRLGTAPWSSLAHTGTRAALEDAAGRVWIATGGRGVIRLEGRSPRNITTRDGLSDDDVWAVLEGRDGTLWFGTSAGVTRWREGKATIFSLGPGRIAATVLAEDQEGAIWVGTSGDGLFRIAGDKVASVTSANGLSADQVLAIAVDREGSIWVGTEDGLDRFERTAVQGLTADEGLPLGAPGALAWSEGTLWIAPVTGGLFRTEPSAEGLGRGGRVQFVPAGSPSLTGDQILALAPAGEAGGLWVGRESGGLTHIGSGAARGYTARDGLGSNTVTAVLQDRHGTVWVGTDNGVNRISDRRITTYGQRDGLPGSTVRCLLQDRRGAVWIGMTGGLAKIEGDSIVSYTVKSGLGGREVFSLLEDTSGTIWAGLSTGLGRMHDGKLTAIAPEQGLAERAVRALQLDPVGDLWLAGDEGISRVPLAELNAVADGRLDRVHPVIYGPQEGLPGSSAASAVTPNSLRTPDGRLWFSFSRGIAVVDPSQLRRNPVPPPVHIEALTVDGRNVPLADQVAIPTHARRIELRFTALSLLVPRQVRFRYMLDGVDRQWMEAGAQRRATYTHLRPGRYRFHVLAANNDGVWNEAGAELTLRVPPAFYEAWWFYATLILAGIAVTYVALRVRHRRVEARFALVLAERTRIAREIHDTLLQGFTGITLQLQALVARLKPSPDAREQFERVLTLADATLSEARRAVWDMRAPELENRGLAEALVDAARAAVDGSGVELRTRVSGKPRRLMPVEEAALFRIGREATANAVKHAEARVIELDLAYHRRSVRLSVRDDGRGIQIDRDTGAHAGHWGVLGMQERAEQAGGHLTIRGSDGGGTEVVVTIRTR
jgi:signal transduction histidine kinase/ligand-binding sensor domain-containing protein